MLFDIRTFDSASWTVVSVVGDVDLATLPTLSGRLSSTEADALALDLSGVDHFDPLCFGVVISAALKMKRRGGRFSLICPSGRPRELLAETGVDQIVDLLPTQADLP